MSEMQLEKTTTNGIAKSPPASHGAAKAPLWNVTPELDLYESGNEYLIQLDVPGASAESVNVQVVGTRVFIRAEQAAGAAPEANSTPAVALAAFERQLELPGEVDPDSASAELRNGVLEIRIAKSASSRRVKIKVNAN
jgi:HSP20 family protein